MSRSYATSRRTSKGSTCGSSGPEDPKSKELEPALKLDCAWAVAGRMRVPAMARAAILRVMFCMPEY